MPREPDFEQELCADIDGFSRHAAVRWDGDDREAFARLSPSPTETAAKLLVCIE
jgi:hypothetical protein